jgi:uncharacterized protein (TIGR03643 family)
MTHENHDNIIRMAWEDRTSFEEIEKKTGLCEAEVIKLMRKEMKPSSFRMWRKRVSGRITKHRKLFLRRDKPAIGHGAACLDDEPDSL